MNAPSPESMLRVIFAPDFRKLGPYQQLLAEALLAEKTGVEYLRGYRRGMPLLRGLHGLPMDLLHLHYPVHYFLKGDKWDLLRKLRFPFDLRFAARGGPLVYTVHDLYPLDCREDFLIRTATRSLLHRADALIVHAPAAMERIVSDFGIPREKCAVIPHGDLSAAHGPPLPRETARAQLGIGDEKICLAFGSLNQGKDTEGLIQFWKRERPDATLAIVGRSIDASHARRLSALASGVPNISMRIGFQSDGQLRLWFSAADCAVINYRKIFTSGVASLARSYGLPVLLPARHTTIDLREPHPSVFRFDSLDGNFGEMLRAALRTGPDYDAAAEWRKAIAWDGIAAQTRRVYDIALARWPRVV